MRIPGRAVQGKLKAFSAAQVKVLLEECRNSPRWGLVFEALLYTGMRIGELSGLRWCHLVGNRLEVCEVVVSQAGMLVHRPETKTWSGYRVLFLSSEALSVFERQRQAFELLVGHPASPEDFVFPNSSGGMMRPTRSNQHLKLFVKRLGLPPLSIHAFRHTYATLHLRAGVPVAVVSRNIGHRNITTTLNVYRHVLEDEREAHLINFSEVL